MHLRSVLKATPVWEGLLEAWRNGAVIAGSSAGAMALCDPMVDPRGGAFTLGLGLLEQVAVIPHHDQWSHDRSRRTFDLAGSSFPIVAVDEQTAAIRGGDGTWRAAGLGKVQVMLDGQEVGLDHLPYSRAGRAHRCRRLPDSPMLDNRCFGADRSRAPTHTESRLGDRDLLDLHGL